MEFLLTCDPNVIIEYKEEDFLFYWQIEGDRWVIVGRCTHNGSCIDGAINPDLRPYNERLDCPVRPDIDCKGCPLRGVYL